MDLAVLTALTGRQPLIIVSDQEQAPFDLAQICTAYSLECATIEPQDLHRPGLGDDDVNVLIVKDLHSAHRNVQVLALELIRKKARNNDLFLLIALLPMEVEAQGPPYLTPHLMQRKSHAVQNDLFFFAFTQDDDEAAILPDPLTKDAIVELQNEATRIRVSAEIWRYTHDIVSFIRLHRACGPTGGGASAVATRQLYLLSKVLAVLNGLSFVTPSLVGMAARKIYTHRLVITDPEDERSMQWGSNLEAVTQSLRGMTNEKLIEEVLATVDCPL
ncbi:MAG: hypothetical protein Q9159_007216 [Coniocarpon cinnabarinum]